MLPTFFRRLYWVAWARMIAQRKILGFQASILSFCNVNCTFGQYSYVGRQCNLTDVSMGRYSYIGRLSHARLCTIGNFCSIGQEVRLGGLGIHPKHISTHPAFFNASPTGISFHSIDGYKDYEPINIGHDVWIGDRAMVMGGITIASGAIVAAGAVVTRDVGPYEIVAGVPARSIGLRIPSELISDFIASEWWYWSDEKLSKFGPKIGCGDFPEFLQSATGG